MQDVTIVAQNGVIWGQVVFSILLVLANYLMENLPVQLV